MTLYELSKLSDDEWRAIEPHLTPDLQRKDIKGLLPAPTPATPAVPSKWRAEHAERGAEILESLPDDARETAAAIVNEDAVPDEIGLRILETMGEMDEAEQTEVVKLYASDDGRDKNRAKAKLAKVPPMPDPRFTVLIALSLEVGSALNKCLTHSERDARTGFVDRMTSLLNSAEHDFKRLAIEIEEAYKKENVA